MMFNPAIRSFEVVAVDQAVGLQRDAAIWLRDTTDRMLAYLNSVASNWSLCVDEMALSLVRFGTGPVLAVEKPGTGLRFIARRLEELFLNENDEEEITEIYRLIEMTVDQMVEKFSRSTDRVPDQFKRKVKSGDHDTKIEIIHAIFKRDAFQTQPALMLPGERKPWASVWLTKDSGEIIRESGFNRNPYLIPRWRKAPQEVYGRSPAMDVLNTVKALNAMERTTLIASELRTRPPINAPADSHKGPIRTIPGWINWYKRGVRDFAQPMDLGADPASGEAMIQRYEARVHEAFFLDTLKLPTAQEGGGQPRMTREEVIQRRMEGLFAASPITSRLQTEFFVPALTILYEWMLRNQMLAPIPDVLVGRDLTVDFMNPLAISQRSSQSQSVNGAVATMAPLMTPEVLDNFDPDETSRGIWRMWNAPPEFLRDRREVARIREQRAEMQQAAQTATIAREGAAAAKDATSALEVVRAG